MAEITHRLRAALDGHVDRQHVAVDQTVERKLALPHFGRIWRFRTILACQCIFPSKEVRDCVLTYVLDAPDCRPVGTHIGQAQFFEGLEMRRNIPTELNVSGVTGEQLAKLGREVQSVMRFNGRQVDCCGGRRDRERRQGPASAPGGRLHPTPVPLPLLPERFCHLFPILPGKTKICGKQRERGPCQERPSPNSCHCYPELLQPSLPSR